MDDSNQPATKGDLAGLEERVDKKLQALEERVDKKLQALEEQIRQVQESMVEAMHDMETRLLKAFYTFAESTQQRLAQVEGNTNAVISRLATIESRVTEVEKRLNMPPQPQ
jgi:chromosome segregation ATPase